MKVSVPALYVAGERDPVLGFPASPREVGRVQ